MTANSNEPPIEPIDATPLPGPLGAFNCCLRSLGWKTTIDITDHDHDNNETATHTKRSGAELAADLQALGDRPI